MNKAALLVVAFCVASLYGFGVGLNTCDSSEEAIHHCISVIFDRNKDGVITMDELERSFGDRVQYSSNLNATMVMRGGDLNGDGVLTDDDWTHPNRTLLKNAIQLDMACFWCRQNGVNMDLTFEGQKKKINEIKHV
jgi:hypothetical protein